MKDFLIEQFIRASNYIPFILISNKPDGREIRVNAKDLIQFIIIAAISGLVSGFIAISEIKADFKVMTSEMNAIRQNQILMKQEMNDINLKMWNHATIDHAQPSKKGGN